MRHVVISNSKVSSEIYPVLLIYMLLEILNVLLHHLLHSKGVFSHFMCLFLDHFKCGAFSITLPIWSGFTYVCTVNVCLPTV